MPKTVPILTVQLSMSTQFKWKYSLIVKTFLFWAFQFSQAALVLTIQFSISTQLVLFNPYIDATIPGQNGPGSNDNEGVLHIPTTSSITGTSPLDCIVSYSRHSLGTDTPPTEVQLVYSTGLADWAIVSKHNFARR